MNMNVMTMNENMIVNWNVIFFYSYVFDLIQLFKIYNIINEKNLKKI